MAQPLVLGDKEILKILDELPNNVRINAVSAAAQKGGKVIAKRAKQVMDITTNYKGSDNGFSKAKYIRKNIKSLRRNKVNSGTRGKWNTVEGARVQVSGKDIPVCKRFWAIWGYAALLAFGRKKNVGTGTTRGVGDFIVTAGGIAGNRARMIFKRNLVPEVKRAKDRVVKRYGRRKFG